MLFFFLGPETGQQPLSAAELMVALHQMESSNDEMMKHIIGGTYLF